MQSTSPAATCARTTGGDDTFDETFDETYDETYDERWVLALALDWLSSRANNVLKGGRRNTSTSSPMRRRAGETNIPCNP